MDLRARLALADYIPDSTSGPVRDAGPLLADDQSCLTGPSCNSRENARQRELSTRLPRALDSDNSKGRQPRYHPAVWSPSMG